MDYSAHRPKGHHGQGDPYLPRMVRKLRRTLAGTQRNFAHDTLRLPPPTLGEIAGILVDFAEDLHNGTGIWTAYERYNAGFFGTALPLTSTGSGPGGVLDPDRFRHFLWILYPVLLDGLVLSPTHQDLRRIADAAGAFLSDAFSAVPKDSGVKASCASSAGTTRIPSCIWTAWPGGSTVTSAGRVTPPTSKPGASDGRRHSLIATATPSARLTS
jgi:hypothetical protein